MSHVLRLSACAAVIAVFFAGAWATRPVVFHDLGLDLWEWPALQQSFDSQMERKQELIRHWQTALRRDEMKAQICKELIASRFTLRETARRFAELPQLPERLWEDLRRRFPEGTDEERMCRHVLEWVGDLSEFESLHPDESLRRRWQEEYQAAFGRPLGHV